MKYQAILFDFDYTLGDATASIYEGFCYAFEKMGYPRPDREAVRRTVGHMLEDEFTMLTGVEDPAQRAEFRRWFQEKVADTQAEKTDLLPGAEELLGALHQRGVKLGIVTSKRNDTLRKILARHGVLDRLDFTVGGDLVWACPSPTRRASTPASPPWGWKRRMSSTAATPPSTPAPPGTRGWILPPS